MNHSIAELSAPAVTMNSRFHTAILFAITTPSFLLAGLCLQWYVRTDEVALLLLGLVTLGMAYDFLSHILGLYMQNYSGFLRWYSRLNFWALCFGIPFTAFAGTFIMAEVQPDGVSAALADNYLLILHGSVLFGALFLFARYKKINVQGAIEFTLDKSHVYTNTIFIVRRIILALTLVIGITVVIDAWSTDWFIWSLLFTGTFIASIPLHILHKQIPSMLSEVVTQIIAIYGSYLIFVA